MKKYLSYFLIVLSVLVGGSVFYNRVYIPKTTYETIRPTKGDMQLYVFGIGNVDAKNRYDVGAGVSARIEALFAEEGSWVRKGDLLAKLDPVDVPALVEQARIGVERAQSEHIALQKELRSLQAQKKLAAVTFRRYAKLKEQSFASQAEYDKAKADLDAIEAQIEATKAHIDSSKTQIKQARKALEAIREKLKRFDVFSPVRGYVVDKHTAIGETLSPTQPIYTVVQKRDIRVRTYIDERLAAAVQTGARATIILRSKKNETLRGFVDSIDPQSDKITQERTVYVAFETLPVPFYLNEQARVRIATKKLTNVLQIPLHTLVRRQGEVGVWIKHNNRAHFQKVVVLGKNDTYAAVENLANDATVLVPQQSKKPLHEGMRVH